MRSIALAFILLISLGVAASPEYASVGTQSASMQTEQWIREYMNRLGQEVLDHRTYLRVLLTTAVVVAAILGAFIVWLSWQNRKDIRQIGRYSNEEINKKIEEYIKEIKRELSEHRTEIREQLDQETQAIEKSIDDIRLTERYSNEEIDKKIQENMNQFNRELLEYRTEIDQKTQAFEKMIREYKYINDNAIGSMQQLMDFISQSTLSKYEFYHLDHLNKAEKHTVKYSDALIRDIRRLEALDFINGIDNEAGHEAIFRMIKEESFAKEAFDLKQFFRITERGKKYLKQRMS